MDEDKIGRTAIAKHASVGLAEELAAAETITAAVGGGGVPKQRAAAAVVSHGSGSLAPATIERWSSRP